MINPIVLSVWLALTIGVAIPAFFAIWSRRTTRARGLAVGAFLLASPVAAGCLASALGWPIPVLNGVTAPAGDWTILGNKMIVGRGIYLLIDVSDREPKYVVLPWSKELSEKLQDLMNKGEVPQLVVPPFEFSWNQKETDIQPMPQPKWLPDKPPAPPVNRYERHV